MFRVNSLNRSVQWFGFPAPLRTNGPPWTDNILDPSPGWVNGGNATNQKWLRQYVGPYVSVAVLWIGPVHAMLA